jgi:Protein of unknown function (DUF3987)
MDERDPEVPMNEPDPYGLDALGQPPSKDRFSWRDGSDERPWDEPDLSMLGTGRRAPPQLPIDRLGPFWADWCVRSAAAVSAPVDYVFGSLLASAGAALANVRWPNAGSSWSEPPILWCALVGSPSAGKSPSMDSVFNLVRFAEDRMGVGFEEQYREYETRKHAAEASRDKWKFAVKAAVEMGETPPSMPIEASEPKPPARPRIRVADATTEKLGALAASLPRGLLLQRDELSGWIGAFDRYGGGGSDRAFAIEMYGGRPHLVDRMRTPEPLNIRHLSVGVLGGVQPDKLHDIIASPDDGLASRLLWCWPDALPNFSLVRTPLDDTAAQDAFARLASLSMGSDKYGNPEPVRVRLSPDAEDIIEEFAQEIGRRAEEASDMFAGSLGKARGHILRIATILEYLWWCAARGVQEPETISARAVEAAAALVDAYFIPMAERVFGDAVIPAQDKAAMLLARYLRREKLSDFNARVTRRNIGGLVRDSSMMDAACNVLAEAGLIRPVLRSAGSGRKPKNYEVNPAVHGRQS